ncbi:lantibiotic dehydratase [Streptomyces sp. NPDC091377]|uniref:lantibiotic dehydratase n=1 Tax=Streptomyces sp. NPDC091377 TaxID=3365995 RepID=UPI0037F29DF2
MTDVTRVPGVDGVVVARIAALPVSALEELRCTATWHTVQEIIADRDRLVRVGRDLAVALEGPIGLASGPLKPRLVGLRRSLYAARRPQAALLALPLEAAFAVRLGAWLADHDRLDRLTARLPEVLERERRDKNEVLRRWVATEVFAHGLLQASPALSSALRRWLASPPGTVPPPKVTLRLAKYLARVVAKTSPHATFTMTGLGRWGAETEAARWSGPWRWRSAVEPNVWLLRRLLTDLAGTDQDLAGSFEIRTNPSLAEDEGRLWFLSRTEDQYHSVGATDDLRMLVKVLGDGAGHRVADVRDRLGIPLPVLDRLTGLGLLEVHPPVADQAVRPLADLASRLAPHRVARVLSDVGRALDRYPDAADRVEVHGQVRASLTELAGDNRLPDKNLFHENAVFDSPVLRLGAEAWRPAIADLHTVRGFLGGFQQNAAARLIAGRLFAERFGTGALVPFGRFHRALAAWTGDAPPGTPAAELHALLYRGETGPSVVPELRASQDARERASAALRDRRPDPDGTIRIDPVLLDSWRSGEPSQSLACFVQVVAERPTRLVLNGVAVGHGAMRSRVHRLLGSGPAHPRADRADRADQGDQGDQGDGTTAEIVGGFGTNVNLRSPAASYEIDYPGVVSGRPVADRVPLRELAVRHDPGTGHLVLLDAGRRALRPLHTGMMAALFLPGTARLLLQLFGDLPGTTVPTWAIFSPPPPRTPEGVVRTARVEVGRVAVARAAWYAPRDAVPRRAKGETEAAHLLALARWFRDHAIPTRCFVSSLDPDSWCEDPWRTARLAKPTYLDLADPALVTLLDRRLRDSGACVVFHEPLPEFTAATDLGEHGRHVTEFVVELTSAPEE